MASMNKSMLKALDIIKYTIIWFIIGVIIIYLGFNIYRDTNSLILSAIVTFIGIAIISCGFLASFMKVNTELILEEFKNIKPEPVPKKEEIPKIPEVLKTAETYKKSEEKDSILWDIITVISVIILIYIIILYY